MIQQGFSGLHLRAIGIGGGVNTDHGQSDDPLAQTVQFLRIKSKSIRNHLANVTLASFLLWLWKVLVLDMKEQPLALFACPTMKFVLEDRTALLSCGIRMQIK